MNDLNPGNVQPMQPPNSDKAPQNPLIDYKFSNDELRVLRECNTESFFQRSLPFGTLLGLSTYYGVKAGYLKGSPRWGPVPKVMLAVTVGYFLGKFSYQKRCVEKMMQLPNSRLGELLRQRRKGSSLQEVLEPNISGAMGLPFAGIGSNDTYSDVGDQANSLDLDTYRPMEGLDDSGRPTLDTPLYQDESIATPTNKSVSYDELRMKNRESYQKNRGVNYRTPVEQAPIRSESSGEASSPVTKTGAKTKYGDVWE